MSSFRGKKSKTSVTSNSYFKPPQTVLLLRLISLLEIACEVKQKKEKKKQTQNFLLMFVLIFSVRAINLNRTIEH